MPRRGRRPGCSAGAARGTERTRQKSVHRSAGRGGCQKPRGPAFVPGHAGDIRMDRDQRLCTTISTRRFLALAFSSVPGAAGSYWPCATSMQSSSLMPQSATRYCSTAMARA